MQALFLFLFPTLNERYSTETKKNAPFKPICFTGGL